MSALNKCLELEANAIKIAAKRLSNQQVEKSLELINRCSLNNSKLILTGVGKSGIVARKISATFSSIGITSIYLNPLDALHGDLGVVSSEDTCILISNSGETYELLQILPHLTKRGTATISIVGKVNSSLAQRCDSYLEAFVDREVCPLNLAPTASTAVAMAIGDSLASVIMERNGISNEEFALNHPSGFLGKKLTLLVSDIMIPIKKFKYLNPESKFQDIIEIITGGKIGCGLVINNEKLELEGIITDGDIRRALKDKSPKDWGEINATDLMTKNPITIDHKVLAFEAIKTMENNNKNKLISTLPVINQKGNKKHVIGILQMHDIVQAGLR